MEPLIDPSTVYKIATIDNIRTFLCVFEFLVGACAATGAVIAKVEEAQDWFRSLVRLTVAGSIVGVVGMFIPAKDTMYAMYLSGMVTEDTPNEIRQAIKSDIIEILKAVDDEED